MQWEKMISFITGLYTIKYLGVSLTRNVIYKHEESYKMKRTQN